MQKGAASVDCPQNGQSKKERFFHKLFVFSPIIFGVCKKK